MSKYNFFLFVLILIILVCGIGYAQNSPGSSDLVITPARYPFPQNANIRYAVPRVMPGSRSQAQMNQDVIDQFKKILQEYFIEQGTSNSDNPDEFRMAIFHTSGGNASNNQITCSESMGYGMLMLAYMAGTDEHFMNNSVSNQNLKVLGGRQLTIKDYFDGMYRTLISFPTRTGSSIDGSRRLIAWELVANGRTQSGNWPGSAGPWRDTGSSASSATDGDLDIIYALLLADKQWGSNGRYNYRQQAERMIRAMWQDIVDKGNNGYHLKIGNWASSWQNSSNLSRPSDFMLTHLRTFKAYNNNDWQRVINQTNNIIGQITNQQSPRNGLLPGFVFVDRSTGVWQPNHSTSGSWHESWTGGSSDRPTSTNDDRFDWNACRVPWRLGTDILLYGDTTFNYGGATPGTTTLGETCVKPLFEFLLRGSSSSGGANGNFNSMRRNHLMNGTGSTTGINSAYGSPLAVVTAIYGTPAEMEAAWTYMRTRPFRDGAQYGDYINVLCMIVASGNWWAPEMR
ncbi:MAG: glycosyl hydrolase family 8 [Treponema sp.]|nr:glycosyl hydrolase family 8 [Treponema sp.]